MRACFRDHRLVISLAHAQPRAPNQKFSALAKVDLGVNDGLAIPPTDLKNAARAIVISRYFNTCILPGPLAGDLRQSARSSHYHETRRDEHRSESVADS
jgi:hypothetical protein